MLKNVIKLLVLIIKGLLFDNFQ